ncbi:MAG TPA: carboxylating nicotinate-nucleotide diphosphorylase [Candidatus Mailhella merdavium]|nr:carboxylating nicotinate-nucleotide diphosphorylase [Candidatus Mailhella merdavium]
MKESSIISCGDADFFGIREPHACEQQGTTLFGYVPEDVAAIFPGEAGDYARQLVRLALDEDGPDLTSLGVFSPEDVSSARIVAKQDSLVAGLPLISLVLAEMGLEHPSSYWEALTPEASSVRKGDGIARIWGSTCVLLKAERVILNLLSHLSGIANLTRLYVNELSGTGVRLLDTRKTLPGQRYLEKYAVRVGGGCNHRVNLAEMLMLKDNHIDAAGSIGAAVAALRARYVPCPPIEVECRTQQEVREAVEARPERILLDNMGSSLLAEVLPLIPRSIEAEISGGVELANIRELALACPSRPADFISVGRITHSAPAADFSMKIERQDA